MLIRLSQTTEIFSNFQAEGGVQLHSSATRVGFYRSLAAKIACSWEVLQGVCDNRISTVQTTTGSLLERFSNSHNYISAKAPVVGHSLSKPTSSGAPKPKKFDLFLFPIQFPCL